jgi:MarR family transcriptional regulator, lower aerobic nicotinate degradation pathway regulator
MDKYDLLKELINKIEDYEQDITNKSSLSIDDFIAYLQTNSIQQNEYDPHFKIEILTQDPLQIQKRLIVQYLTYLNRYARLYSKKALKDSPFNTIDEFSYLATLFEHRKLTKTDLIEKNIHEKPVGTEVIRRLIAKGMINEQNNENDKRSQFLVLTPIGEKALFDAFSKMDPVATLIIGNLSEKEKMQLHYVTKKLHHYHNEIFLNKKT